MAISLSDITATPPVSTDFQNIGSKEFGPYKGDPGELIGFMRKIHDLEASAADREKQAAPEEDLSLVDPEKFRKVVQTRIGGDWRKVNLMEETRRLYNARLPGLRSHVFQGRIPQRLTPAQQNFLAGQAAKLWQVCAMEAKAKRDNLMQQETFAMDELNRRRDLARRKAEALQKQRRAGIDLRKEFTGPSAAAYLKTGDVSVLKKYPRSLSVADRVAAEKLVDTRMETWAPPLQKDENGNYLMPDGKPATQEQLARLEQAERERLQREIYGPGLAQVQTGTGSTGDVRSIFGGKKTAGTARITGPKPVGSMADGTPIYQNPDGSFRIGKPPAPAVPKSKEIMDLIRRARKEVPNFGEDAIRNMMAAGRVDEAVGTLKKMIAAAQPRVRGFSPKVRSGFAQGPVEGSPADRTNIAGFLNPPKPGPDSGITVAALIRKLAGSGTGTKKMRRWTNSLSRKYGKTRLVDPAVIADIKASGKKAGIAARRINRMLAEIWRAAGEPAAWGIEPARRPET